MVTSLLKPTNQASFSSSLVPVLPPTKDEWWPIERAVPRASTPCRMLRSWNAAGRSTPAKRGELRLLAVDDLAVALDRLDDVRRRAEAFVGDRGVEHRHVERPHRLGAEHERIVALADW